MEIDIQIRITKNKFGRWRAQYIEPMPPNFTTYDVTDTVPMGHGESETEALQQLVDSTDTHDLRRMSHNTSGQIPARKVSPQ